MLSDSFISSVKLSKRRELGSLATKLMRSSKMNVGNLRLYLERGAFLNLKLINLKVNLGRSL